MKGILDKLNLNPYLAYWINLGMSSTAPDLEEERNLRIRKVITKDFKGQNIVGLENLTKGRMSKRVIQLHKWFMKEQNIIRNKKRLDFREVLKQVLEIVLQCWYAPRKQ